VEDLDEVIDEFVVECLDNLDQLDRDVLALQDTPDDGRTLARVFRTMHTIKGTCGFLGFHRLETIAHTGENLLSKLRDGTLVPTPEIASALVQLANVVRHILATIATEHREGDDDHAALVELLAHLGAGRATPMAEAAPNIDAPENRSGECVSRADSSVRIDARLLPVGSFWAKFGRMVRDVAASLGKNVRLEVDGEHTAHEKTIGETIKGPLVHLVRNAIDHGIESPAERAAAGKPAEARLVLRTRQKGGQLVVEVIDDGRGIDAVAVRRQAVELGLVPSDVAARMTNRQAFDLLFVPGFSTATQVTNFSGRGVGLDVVKTDIEHIGGTVDVCSRPGAGTKFRLQIPQTLATVPSLVARTGESR
jgi:two-component system chemotaxis sensor kinase CheA